MKRTCAVLLILFCLSCTRLSEEDNPLKRPVTEEEFSYVEPSFEGTSIRCDYESMAYIDHYYFTFSQNLANEVVDNPRRLGANLTLHCLKVTENEDSSGSIRAQVFWTSFGHNESSGKIIMKVLSPRKGAVLCVKLYQPRIFSDDKNDLVVVNIGRCKTTMENSWEDIVFDFKGKGSEYAHYVTCFELTPGDGECNPGDVWYFDEFRL